MTGRRHRHAAVWLAALAFALTWGTVPCWGADTDWAHVEEPIRFLRRVHGEDGEPKALQAAVIRCRPVNADRPGPVVDLVSAVHVAEPEYYRALNRKFRRYDAVLYELVAPEGTRVPEKVDRSRQSPVSLLQLGLTDLLELQFQLEGVDYNARNFIHADMSPEQFAQSMRDRSESFTDIVFRMMGYNMARQNEGAGRTSDAQLLTALFSGDRAMVFRRIMAAQFEDMQGAMAAIEGPEGSTLITERNKVALAVLRRELAAGRRKVAVFYGAGHMDDMLTRLRDDFELVPAEIRWLTAWKLQ